MSIHQIMKISSYIILKYEFAILTYNVNMKNYIENFSFSSNKQECIGARWEML
jgi:hypothetical protein